MFESVLVAADLRRDPDPAIVSGARLARLTGAELHFVHCLTGDGELRLDSVRELLPSGVELSVQKGEPHEAITHHARTVGADVVVLGPRLDRSPVRGFLGTTADSVIRASRVPCLLSNALLPELPRRILLAMDRSRPARAAFGVCSGLARVLSSGEGGDVSVHLLTVSTYAQTGRRGAGAVDLKKLAEKMEEAVGAGSVSHTVIPAPLPAEGILAAADSFRPDLLIMGTHGSSVIGRLLMGSVAQEVARSAPTPLLLVPPRPRSRVTS